MIAVVVTAIGVSSAAQAQTVLIASPDYNKNEIGVNRRFGLGLDLGYPFNGITGKYFFSERNALQVDVGYNTRLLGDVWSDGFTDAFDGGFGIRAAYLGHPAVLTRNADVTIPFFIGIGLGHTWDVQSEFSPFEQTVVPGDNVASAFVPIGVAFQLRRTPLDFFVQLEPGIDAVYTPGGGTDSTVWRGNGRLGFGGRYYF